jgi:hypothetical protein
VIHVLVSASKSSAFGFFSEKMETFTGLVFGGCGGIGVAVCKELIKHGCKAGSQVLQLAVVV